MAVTARASLARSRAESVAWRDDFIRTFLERDVRNLGMDIPAPALRRLWTMAAHSRGGVLTTSELGRSLGVAHTTVRRHLDVLEQAFVLRLLPPWFENLEKRQVKSPKLYVRDSGLLHSLLGIPSHSELEGHPKLGASWEGLVVEETVRIVGERNAFFWATPAGAELDLFVQHGGRRIGIEIKHADAPRLTRSLQTARADLRLDDALVVYPGEAVFPLADGSRVVPLARLREALDGPVRRSRASHLRPAARRRGTGPGAREVGRLDASRGPRLDSPASLDPGSRPAGRGAEPGLGVDNRMARRISWPELSRSAEYQGLWVALDNCRYDPASMEPVEGDVVDVDEDIAVLCDRLRGLHRKACSILFCDGDVMVESRPAGRRSDPGARSTL